MTDEDSRMDRAKRIRRMREGQRENDDETDQAAEAADETEREPAPGGATQVEAPPESEETPADAATEDDGDAAADQPGPDLPSDLSEAVDAVSDISADVPSSDEIQAALETVEEAAAAAESAAEAEPVETDEATDVDSEDADADQPAPAGPAGVADQRNAREAETRVLEFTLADEQYCLDIEYIEEIVKHEHITRVPNTPDYVEGVVDLRGQITTILNPKVAIGKDDDEAGRLIVVFDVEAFDEQGHIGWVVDDVSQVSPVTDDQVNDPPVPEDYINGVIDRDDQDGFVIWTSPDLALEESA